MKFSVFSLVSSLGSSSVRARMQAGARASLASWSKAVLYPGLVLGLVLSVLFGFSTLRAADPLKVGFVYIGPIGDHGWTFEHHRGLTVVEDCSATA